MKNEKTIARTVGIALYIIAALFCISILAGFFDTGMGVEPESPLSKFGVMLFSAYGLSTILIPIFLLIAGTFCFSAKWTYQKATGLLVSVIPFFTIVMAEKWSRNIAATDYSPIALVKIISLLAIALLLVIAEYLIALVIAGKIHDSKSEDSEVKKPKEKKEKKEKIRLPKFSILKKKEDSDSDEVYTNQSDVTEEEDLDAKINASVDAEIEKATAQAASWSLTELMNENKRILDTVKEENSSPRKFEILSSEDSDDDFDGIQIEDKVEPEPEFTLQDDQVTVSKETAPQQTVAPVAKETAPQQTVTPVVKETAPQQTVAPVAKETAPQQTAAPVAKETAPQQTVAPVVKETAPQQTAAPVAKETAPQQTAAPVAKETVPQQTVAPVVKETAPQQTVVPVAKETAPQQTLPPQAQEPEPEQEQDWDSFEMEDDEDDIIADFERANMEAQEEKLTLIDDDDEEEYDIPFDDEDHKEPLPFNKGSGVEEEPKNSMFSALDSVFAKMDADAKSEVEQSVPSAKETEAVIKKTNAQGEEVIIRPDVPKKPRRGAYKISTELLTAYEDNPYWVIDKETEQAAQSLKATLSEFKIEAEITGIVKGPVVTMFELLPASGVKLSKIVALQDNIALRLAASSVRIVAPIPGKRAVGIEVPNAKRAIVSFRECIEQNIPEWKKMGVPVVLGKDIEGRIQVMDLVKTPHLLIAGSTGAGKSVCINNMILSILYKRNPNDVKMILIDPKIVELKLYNDIPHLLTPVITEPKRAMQSLQYALCEMERRYALLDSLGVRDISSYNKRIEERKIATEKLPYLVIVIDEFADLMATTGKQLEGVLARLAAMSRAVGIHLVLATQRPSIDVITGLIKANIPSRIAFMVASKTDSRIIIDQVGAEKLLGKGDMLYASATDPFPVRIQGAFVTDQEVESVVAAVKEWGEPEYIDDEIFVDDEDDEGSDQMSLFTEGGEDPLYEKALDIVVQAGKASASYIQRRLKIGYNRAARLVEEMEERGIVGPANGSKPRDIIQMP